MLDSLHKTLSVLTLSAYPGEAEAHADGGVDSHTVVTLLSLEVNGVLSGGTHRC